jgi:PTH1 family peptidyl-tRNA hydrolase
MSGPAVVGAFGRPEGEFCVQWLRGILSRLRRAQEEHSEAPPAYVVFGLGNPGLKYDGTRHNIGFRILECVAERQGSVWRLDAGLEARVADVELGGRPGLLVEPQTFMNQSGRSVVEALSRWGDLQPPTDLLVVYDDMDLPTGRIRLRPSGGGGGHRGIGHILEELESKEIPRLRFGIGHPGSGGSVLDWVLTTFSDEEESILAEAVGRAADALEAAATDGVSAAMGQFNSSS